MGTALPIDFSAPPDGGQSVDSLVGGPPKALTQGLSDLTERKIESDDAVFQHSERLANQDRVEMQRAFERTGHGPDDLKPWNVEAERKKTEYNPIEAFGSIGSVFGILASAFTHAPLANALNASAAAMEAVRAGKEDEFEKNFNAWKANNDLAVKRYEMERQHFTDASTLMERDLAAGTRAAQQNALRFGDQKAKLLLDNGMVKEWYELQESRAKLAEENIRLNGEITQDTLRRKVLETDPGWNVGKPAEGQAEATRPPVDPRLVAVRKLEAFNRAFGVKETTQQELMGRWMYEHPTATADEAGDFYRDTFVKGSQTLNAQQYQAVEDLVEQGVPRDEAIRRVAIAKGGSGGAAGDIPGRNKQHEINQRQEQYEKENIAKGMDPTAAHREAFERANREVNQTTQVVSANRADEIRSHVDLIDNSTTKIDQALGVLDRYAGAAGIAGRVTRLGERVGNLLGSNATDRDQFMRDVEYLKMLAPRLLMDARGRPLSSEAGRIDSIVGGLSLGDTTANTIRSLEEVKQLYEKMRQDNVRRLEGTWRPGGSAGDAPAAPGAAGEAAGAPATPKAGQDDWWSSSPKASP